MDSAGSIPKSIASMLRAYISKDIGLGFTASQAVDGKRVLKSTQLFQAGKYKWILIIVQKM